MKKMYQDTIEIETESFSMSLALHSIVNVNINKNQSNTPSLMKLLENISSVHKSKIVSTNIVLSDIIVCRKQSDVNVLLSNKDSIQNKTIFIDRFDYMQSDELVEFIRSGKNQFIINSRTGYEKLDLHAESIMFIHYDREHHRYYSENVLENMNYLAEVL